MDHGSGGELRAEAESFTFYLLYLFRNRETIPLMESRGKYLISSTCTGEGQLTSVCVYINLEFQFYVYGYLHVYLCITYVPVPVEARRGHRIHWN